MKIAVSLLQLVALAIISPVFAAESIDIDLKFTSNQQQRVVLDFEHEGKIVLRREKPAKDGSKYQRLPMKTLAKLGYYQRFSGKGKSNQAIRFYDQAKGRYQIQTGKVGTALGRKNQLVVARVKPGSGKHIQMASIVDTLSQSELELLRNPLDPLSVPALINRKKVKRGSKWKPTDSALANFMAVDRIIRNDVELSLRDVRAGKARIFVLGKLRAAIDDVTTDIEVSCEIKIALGEFQMLEKIKLDAREIRQPGQLAPGFDGRTSVALVTSPDNSCKHLTNETLAKLTKGKTIEQRLKLSLPGLVVKYDPRWRTIAAEDEAAILRFLNNGNLLAQCNIVKLPARPANRPLGLKNYRKEVGRIIAADQIARIVDDNEYKTKNGVRVLSVEVEGKEGGVPVTWLYYHVNNTDGRRMTFVFTLESDFADGFRPHDRKLVEGLAFVAKPAAAASAARRDTKPVRK